MPTDAGKITVKVSLDLSEVRELIDTLGLTAEQVTKLTECYFAMPKKVSTREFAADEWFLVKQPGAESIRSYL